MAFSHENVRYARIVHLCASKEETAAIAMLFMYTCSFCFDISVLSNDIVE